MCNDRKWLEISKENKSILINFLENVKRKGLSEYIPLLDSIIEINYKNEKFLEKLKNIQDDIKNKDNNESELIVKEYVNELIENYSKRYKLKDGNIQEVEKQTRFDIKDSGEIDFFIAGAGELDGVCFDDKDKPTVFFVNFCTTKKETSEQHQIFRHILKFIKYVEENFGITNVVPKVFNQSLIPDLYRKKQGNGWYKNKDIKLEQSEKSAFNVLSSLNFMYHQINSLGIEELSKKADNILEIVKIQPFDTKDLETFNSFNSFEEKFQYIAQQTIHVAKFFAKNQQYLSSDNYSGNKKDLYMSFFDACLYVEDKLKNNQDSTNEKNNFLQEYKNGIKNILNNVWSKQDMISIAESDGSRNKLFSMFLEKFNLINIEQKQEKIKNFNIEF